MCLHQRIGRSCGISAWETSQERDGALNDVTETESVDESTDASMETWSDGGSTVRELNRQLESSNEEGDDGDGMGTGERYR